MSKTKLDICNMALAILGQVDVSSLTEENQRAFLCNQYYDVVRQQLLRAHDWTFAKAREKLTLIREDESGLGFQYIYNKPAACLFVTRIYNDALHRRLRDNEFTMEYDSTLKVEVIRTDLEDAYVEYVRDVEDTSIFDALFIEALSSLLAYKIAHSLTGSTQITQLAYQQYQMALDNARYSNKVQQLEDAVIANPYLDTREM